MDKIEVRCPSCGKLLRAPVSAAGRNAKCPSCGQLMQLPAAPDAPAPAPGVPPVPVPGVAPQTPQQPVYDAEDVTSDPFAAPAPAPTPSPAASPFGGPAQPAANDPFAQGGGGGDAYGLNSDPFAAAPASAPAPQSSGDVQRRPCPSCGEMIPMGAATCRFCGEIFDARLHQQASRSRSSGYSNDDDLEAIDWVLCILCSGIGCIVGIVYLIQGKPKGAKMIGIAILFAIIWNVISALMQAAGGGL